jgi:hypothetical protein
MPLAKPKDRPDTDLEGLDLLEAKAMRKKAPHYWGRDYGLLWAAWPSSSSGADFCLYVMRAEASAKATADGGDLLKRHERTRGRTQRRRYHPVNSLEDVLDTLSMLYWRTRERPAPLEELQRKIRRQTAKKIRLEHHEQKGDLWRSTWRIETEHVGGKTRNRAVRKRA